MLCHFRYVPSQGDTVVYEALSGVPPSDLPHALRWYNHITSFGAEKAKFPGVKKDLQSYGAGPATNGAAKNNDEDFDLFGSDSEEVFIVILCFRNLKGAYVTRIRLFMVNSVLNSLLGVLTQTQNVPVEL